MSESARSPALEQDKQGFSTADLLGRAAPLLFLLFLIAVLSYLEPGFRTELNLFNVLRQISMIGIMAVGMTFVILTAGIDLSVGSMLAFCGMAAAVVARGSRSLLEGNDPGGMRVLWAALAAIGLGLLLGLIQGTLVGYVRIPAFVVTLGGLSAWRGATLLLTDGQPISGFSEDFRWWGQGFVGSVPVPVIIFSLFVVIAFIVLRYSQYGRWIYAIGGNEGAARLSGLNTTLLKISVYGSSGFCAGVAGFLLTARLNSAQQIAGQGDELQVIAAVVIGGTSLFGGEGGVIGTFIGAVLIGVLNNGLVMLNVSPYWQPIVTGTVVVLSVFIDQFAKQRRRRV